jgi:hyperosmotically inducible protein
MKTNALWPFLLGAVAGIAAQAVAAQEPPTAGARPAAPPMEKSDHPVSDTWITTKVKSELATTKEIKSRDIDVKTVNGVVTLTGMQDTSAAIQKAIAVARGVKGVADVDSSGLIVKSTSSNP